MRPGMLGLRGPHQAPHRRPRQIGDVLTRQRHRAARHHHAARRAGSASQDCTRASAAWVAAYTPERIVGFGCGGTQIRTPRPRHRRRAPRRSGRARRCPGHLEQLAAGRCRRPRRPAAPPTPAGPPSLRPTAPEGRGRRPGRSTSNWARSARSWPARPRRRTRAATPSARRTAGRARRRQCRAPPRAARRRAAPDAPRSRRPARPVGTATSANTSSPRRHIAVSPWKAGPYR